MDTRKTNGRDKFPEPRGWALNWMAFAPPSPQDAEAGALRRGRKFPRPRGWALNWDGCPLDEGPPATRRGGA